MLPAYSVEGKQNILLFIQASHADPFTAFERAVSPKSQSVNSVGNAYNDEKAPFEQEFKASKKATIGWLLNKPTS